MKTENDDWQEYESGPYCIHWNDLVDCAEKCKKCKHSCSQHYDNCSQCELEGVSCEGFE